MQRKDSPNTISILDEQKCTDFAEKSVELNVINIDKEGYQNYRNRWNNQSINENLHAIEEYMSYYASHINHRNDNGNERQDICIENLKHEPDITIINTMIKKPKFK